VRQLLRSEDGVALPVASGMLMVISILAVGFFTVSTQVNDTSVDSRSSKRALAAAEAGLQTAVYRLNLLNQSAAANAANCLTTTWVAPTAGGECTGPTRSQTEQLGNDASYTYYVSPATTAGSAGCITLSGVATSSSDRCITSVGTANGVTRRVQTRVVQQPTTTIPDFNSVGLVGKSLVYAWNSVKMSSDVGSNTRVEFQNSIEVNDNDAINVDGKVMLLTGGQYVPGNSVTVEGGTQTVTTPFTLPTPDFETPEGTNNNAALPNSVFEGGSTSRHLRRFQLGVGSGSPSEYTMPPGTYHFCNVRLGSSVKWKFSHTGGARTKIYVDSPSRADSVCAGQADPAGTFGADNSVEINKESGEREELLDIYMHGTAHNDTRNRYSWCADLQSPALTGECRSDFMLDNSVNFYGGVYAPNSTVQAHNSVKIWGSVAADKIRFYNSIEFNLTGPMIDKPPETGATGAASRRGWGECRPAPAVSTDPESGC
jgi:Tfp pilus assembly protein PilX